MSQHHQPTLEEVARLAGVGRGTASRVVNGSDHVSARTREAVERAVRELGYVPNQAARSLKTRRTDTVALVIAEDEQRVFGEPFFAGLVRGISRAVEASSRRLVLSLVPTGEQLARLGQFLTPQHVDGVLVASMHDGLGLPEGLDVPVVYAGRPSDAAAAYVDIDNRGGSKLAVDHLISRGRRRIGYISGPQDMSSGRDRLDGYRDGLKAAGLPFDQTLVAAGDYGDRSGAAAARELLARVGDLDAICAANDPMALGAIRELTAQGRSVPGDVAVVGFDGSAAALSASPALTTVDQPLALMGEAMVDLLGRLIENPSDASDHIILPAELREGAST